MPETITTIDPATGEQLETIPAASPSEIKTAVTKAEAAFKEWSQLPVSKRVEYLASLRRTMVNDLETIVAEITKDTGKVEVEALMADVVPTLELIKYYEQQAEEILAREKRETPLIFMDNYSYIEYNPLGVACIISPWNYPLQLALAPAITAITAGNAVIIKASEVTPLIGELIKRLCKEAGLPANLIQVLQGGSEVGKKLVKTQPDKIFFTGSAKTGKQILAEAAKNLIPVELELGGKDPMIVFSDANLDRAVEAAVYGAFANSGQLCVGVERVYVEEKIYKEFVNRVAKRAKQVRVGSGTEADLGPITYPPQLETIKEHVVEARQKGAKLVTEKKQEDNFFYPLVLKDVDHQMKIMTEETFGPVLPIMPFKSKQEAIELANDSHYGLNSSVWSSDLTKAKQVVNELEVGNSYINDVVKNIGNPNLPFGGEKESGIGRYHGPEGLYSFSRLTSVMVNTSDRKRELNWFPFSKEKLATIKKLIQTNYGEISWWRKAKNYLELLFKLKG